MWNRPDVLRWKAGVLCKEDGVRCRKAGLLYSERGRLEYGGGEWLECGAGRLEYGKVEGYSTGAGRLEYCKIHVEGWSTMQVEKDEVLYRRKVGIQFKWKAGVLYIERGRLEYGAGGRLQHCAGRLEYCTVQLSGWSTMQVHS
jgi:hypothetical protein